MQVKYFLLCNFVKSSKELCKQSYVNLVKLTKHTLAIQCVFRCQTSFNKIHYSIQADIKSSILYFPALLQEATKTAACKAPDAKTSLDCAE